MYLNFSVIYQLVIIIESWVEMKIKQDNVLGTCLFSITFSDINFFYTKHGGDIVMSPGNELIPVEKVALQRF